MPLRNKLIQLFQPDISGHFSSRPNRFVLEIALESGGTVLAHSPNPGRMLELYLPGAQVLLQKYSNPKRKLAYGAVAIRYGNQWVPLVSASANRIAKELVIPRIYPMAENIRPEWCWEGKRIDFTFTHEKRELLMEVKSCSLVEEKLAMFPDAPSIRSSEHLETLAKYSRTTGHDSSALFVISHGSPVFFAPNYHNDPNFALALLKASVAGVKIQVISGRCNRDGSFYLENETISLLLRDSYSELFASDSGWLIEIRPSDKTWLLNFFYQSSGLDIIQRKRGPSARRSGGAVIPFRTNAKHELDQKFRAWIQEQNIKYRIGDHSDARLSLEFDANPLHYQIINSWIFTRRHRMSLADMGIRSVI